MMVYESREELNNIFQAINIDRMSEERTQRQAQTTKDGFGTEVKELRTYPRLKFMFSSDLPMEEWLMMFNKFPALEILQLNYDPNSNIWTYEGQIYEPIP